MTNTLILAINCGSSSLKFGLFALGKRVPLMSGLAECLGEADARLTIKTGEEKNTITLDGGAHGAALDVLLADLAKRGWLASVKGVGHRLVHGGERSRPRR